MALVEMMMPRMGESIYECTILHWLKNVGDKIEADDMIVEVATDKIDTEVGSSHSGILKKILVNEGETATIGKPICMIEVEIEEKITISPKSTFQSPNETAKIIEQEIHTFIHQTNSDKNNGFSQKFYSPLVLNIAKEEGLSIEQLDKIKGTGAENRVTKSDILSFIKNKETKVTRNEFSSQNLIKEISKDWDSQNDEIIEMDRMRKMISARMVESKRISAHVTSFVETDMTNIVQWRERKKEKFMEETGENITFTPILLEAVIKAIKDFPMINIQVDGDKIIRKKQINIGMAVALPTGNLIVPVIHNADSYSLVGLTKKVNDLTNRARINKLTPDDLSDGTYTVSNIGTFGNIMGTPIILQPQVAIIAFGVIQKKPSVIETPQGDLLGIRHKMFISHSYDHRVVDGLLGGQFVKRVSDYLENFSYSEI
jgi:2-oxoglutarate dehydrogenase E2 component (dihydrolipoamide succinyltransferase)